MPNLRTAGARTAGSTLASNGTAKRRFPEQRTFECDVEGVQTDLETNRGVQDDLFVAEERNLRGCFRHMPVGSEDAG